MSQENVEVARRVAEAHAARDADAFNALCDPSFEFQPAITRVEGTGFRGQTAYREFLEAIDQAWDSMETTFGQPTEIDDERVMAAVRLRAISRGGGIPVDQTVTWIMTIRDGTLARIDAYSSVSEALKAVGLEE